MKMNRLNRTDRRKGFTLVELIVVIAMLMLLMGSVTSAVVSAQRRAKIAQATTVVKELTNAILSYENYSKTRDLSEVAGKLGSWTDAERSRIGFVLGNATDRNGEKVPVLYNATMKGDMLVDPWGHPYRVRIKQGTLKVDDNGVLQGAQQTAVAFPNFYRRQMEEK